MIVKNARLSDIVLKVRSKNAGPFWLTVDIFCGDPAVYARVSEGLTTEAVARAFAVAVDEIKRFDIADLSVVKFSLPRPAVQGTLADRDMHGAGFAQVVGDLTL